ncbi:MAG: hypothetical protein H6702_02365 [Myxococcales bacterium]|nr:hypothetical protein [Myxococcales bacterium]
MKPGVRRLLRYGAGALAALALVQGIRVWQAGRREVTLSYQAPPGPLRVEVRGDDGALLRRVEFGAGAVRHHEATLPDGDYRARLEIPGRPAVERGFAVRGEGVIKVAWDR